MFKKDYQFPRRQSNDVQQTHTVSNARNFFDDLPLAKIKGGKRMLTFLDPSERQRLQLQAVRDKIAKQQRSLEAKKARMEALAAKRRQKEASLESQFHQQVNPGNPGSNPVGTHSIDAGVISSNDRSSGPGTLPRSV